MKKIFLINKVGKYPDRVTQFYLRLHHIHTNKTACEHLLPYTPLT